MSKIMFRTGCSACEEVEKFEMKQGNDEAIIDLTCQNCGEIHSITEDTKMVNLFGKEEKKENKKEVKNTMENVGFDVLIEEARPQFIQLEGDIDEFKGTIKELVEKLNGNFDEYNELFDCDYGPMTVTVFERKGKLTLSESIELWNKDSFTYKPYSVCHNCHAFILEGKDNDGRKAGYDEEGHYLCPDCYTKYLNKQGEKNNMENLEKNANISIDENEKAVEEKYYLVINKDEFVKLAIDLGENEYLHFATTWSIEGENETDNRASKSDLNPESWYFITVVHFKEGDSTCLVMDYNGGQESQILSLDNDDDDVQMENDIKSMLGNCSQIESDNRICAELTKEQLDKILDERKKDEIDKQQNAQNERFAKLHAAIKEIPDETVDVDEYCPHCEETVSIKWNVRQQGFRVFCPCCGKRILLCSMCPCNDEGSVGCDWDCNDDKKCYMDTITEEILANRENEDDSDNI